MKRPRTKHRSFQMEQQDSEFKTVHKRNRRFHLLNAAAAATARCSAVLLLSLSCHTPRIQLCVATSNATTDKRNNLCDHHRQAQYLSDPLPFLVTANPRMLKKPLRAARNRRKHRRAALLGKKRTKLVRFFPRRAATNNLPEGGGC